MPRGAKRSNPLTAEYRPRFRDKRSFVSLDGHVYLGKRESKEFLRRTVAERESYRCEECGAPTDWEYGEMDHRQGGLVGRCDCLHNLRWICRPCHRKKHVKPEFSKKY